MIMASRMQQLPLPNNINPPSSGSAAAAASMTRPADDQQGIRCPRCDSPNTKFCYYNNYSHSQPRHFCKTCRRYWTKGGAIRNVPIGGGCRKSNKPKPSRSSSAPSSSAFPLSGFHLSSSSSTNLIPYSYHPIPYDDMLKAVAATGSSSHHLHHGGGSIASSIESLSSINQDLHWELQQQRRLQAMLVAGGDQSQSKPAESSTLSHAENQIGNISFFHQLASTDHGAATTTTERFLRDPYSMPNVNATNHDSTVTTNISNANANDWIGIPTWSDIHQFTEFP